MESPRSPRSRTFRISTAPHDFRVWCGDFLIFLAVNLFVYTRHPLWMARTAFGQRALPNIACPKRFREKRTWRLIFDQNPLWHLFGRKMATKDWMTARASGLHASRTLWSIDSLSDLPPGAFRAGMVVKAGSGCMKNLFLFTDPIDIGPIRSLIEKWLRAPQTDRYSGRYWPKTPQKVFAEELLVSDDGPLIDLNFFCCNGKVHFAVLTVGEKTDEEKIAYFTADGQRIPSIMCERGYRRSWLPLEFSVPGAYSAAAKAAAELSAGIDFVRVDVMVVNGRAYACEMSPFPGEGGYDRTALFRSWVKNWDIRRTWFVSQPKHGFMERYRRALERHLGADRAAVLYPAAGAQESAPNEGEMRKDAA